MALFGHTAEDTVCTRKDCNGYTGSNLARHLGSTHKAMDRCFSAQETAEFERIKSLGAQHSVKRPLIDKYDSFLNPYARKGRGKRIKLEGGEVDDEDEDDDEEEELNNPERIVEMLDSFYELIKRHEMDQRRNRKDEDVDFECVMCGATKPEIDLYVGKKFDSIDLKNMFGSLHEDEKFINYRVHVLVHHVKDKLLRFIGDEGRRNSCDKCDSFRGGENPVGVALLTALNHVAEEHKQLEKIYPKGIEKTYQRLF